MAIRAQLSSFSKIKKGWGQGYTSPASGWQNKPPPKPVHAAGPSPAPVGKPAPVSGTKIGDPAADAWKSDPRYIASVNAAGTSEANVLTDTQYDLGATGQDYGFSSTLNPDGTYTFGTDPSNPFSKAALLQRSFDIAKRGSTNSAAAAGQLYSGSLLNAQAENQHGYDQGYDSLTRAWDAYVQSILRRRRDSHQRTVDTTAGAGADVIDTLAGI